jgi:hypothetical protein
MESREISLHVTSPEEAARVFARRQCLTVSQIPGGALFPIERIALGSHDGTHLDAPYHFFPTSEGRPAKFIDEVTLDWAFADALVLDFRHKKPTDPTATRSRSTGRSARWSSDCGPAIRRRSSQSTAPAANVSSASFRRWTCMRCRGRTASKWLPSRSNWRL